MRRFAIWGLPATLLTFIHASAQNFNASKLDSLAGRFITKVRSFNAEKIMLQTDRNVYVAGEQIWFKACLVNIITNRLDTMSKNLFVDLVDSADVALDKLVLNAAVLQTSGVINIPDTVKTGYYWLRCYTGKMITEDTAAILIQPVYIQNLARTDNAANVLKNKTQNAAPIINYFPEGGFLVTNINSAGAIQVSNSYGNGLVVKGSIVNERDSFVTEFVTNRFGLAKVNFYPLPDEKYFVSLNTKNGIAKYPLPGYNPYVAQLAVSGQDDGNIHAYVALEDAIASPKYTTYLVGISGDSVCFTGVGKGLYKLDIPVENFPGGVATLLLFDARLRLLSERRVFINKDNYQVTIKKNKKDYGARDNVRLDITLNDAKGQPLIATLSVSVQDDRIMQMSDEIAAGSIPPYDAFKLNDWLKRNKDSLSPADIDLLLMAQRPAYINWQNLEMNTFAYNDSTSLLLNLCGKIVNRRNLPVKDRVVTAVSFNPVSPYFGIDTSDAEGDIQIPLPQESDSLTLEVKVTNKHDERVDDSLVINNFTFPPLMTPVSIKKYFINGNILQPRGLNMHHIDTIFTGTGKGWLKPVRVSANAKKQADYDETKRISPFSYIITGDKLGHGAPDEIYNQLLLIPGVSEIGGVLTIYGISSFGGAAEPVAVLDGQVQTASVREVLASLSFRDIDFIEVLRGADAGTFGVRAGHGAISINTRSKARELSSNERPAFKIISPVTYRATSAFKMPDYANADIRNSKSPDPRTTIYWNGNVITDAKGKASVDFYTADDSATYVVTISGLTANGEYIYKRITLNRK
ncbi:MAG TPA: hypothetical protein VG738_24550 [Chitinophagaceae bacterium]|nr:hypothetical protein [Chitinophagaceae bacterium]